MTRPEIIEFMARAIIQAYSPRAHPDAWKAWERHAIAAYDTLTAAGLAIVPIEPSEAMLEAAYRSNFAGNDDDKSIYRAMIAAAIKEQEGRD